MTYIEFFSKDSIENLCAYLACPPERIILIGDKAKLIQKHIINYQKVFSDRGDSVEIVCKAVNKNNLNSIVDALEEIIANYPDCAFGLTGGEELYLVATGIIFDRHKEKPLALHRFNIRNNTIIDCDQDGSTIAESEAPSLSVAENIHIYGGEIIDFGEFATFEWSVDKDFQRDIDAMWGICKENPKKWNAQTSLLAAAEEITCNPPTELQLSASISYAEDHLQGKCLFNHSFFKKLYAFGLLSSYFSVDGTFCLVYKNEQIKRCLTKAGQLLELKIYLEALQATDKDGKKTYNDAKTGVFIDWDGALSEDGSVSGTTNEIDVLLMHGMVPVFVSCKNGLVTTDELYKLQTVASKFGGKYAKKVLICNSLGPDGLASDFLKQRMHDMGIQLIEKISQLSDSEIKKRISTLWCG